MSDIDKLRAFISLVDAGADQRATARRALDRVSSEIDRHRAELDARPEVVRCGECKHGERRREGQMREFIQCQNADVAGGRVGTTYRLYTDLGWYCADGERESE